MDDTKNPQSEEEVVVVEETTEEVAVENSLSGSETSGQATVLLNLEEMIKSHIASLDTLRTEQKKHREMFEDSFNNNPTYRENAEKAKVAIKVKATTRQQIASQPSVIAITNKIKSISQDIKERQSALSDYLLEYQRMTGANEIEDNDGQIREIINSAKLIKRSAKK